MPTQNIPDLASGHMARESIYGSIVVLDLALVVNSLRIVTHHMAAGERRACHTAPALLETSSNW